MNSTTISTRAEPAANATPLWLWWNILSADAPMVAIVWSALFARSRGVALSGANVLALALIVWLIYLGDRILDAWRAGDADALQARHIFSARYRAPLMALGLSVTVATAWLIREDLSALEIRGGLVLGAAVIVYMLTVHLPGDPLTLRRMLPKEIVVGLLFAAGTMLPVWSSVGGFSRATIVLVIVRWALFGMLCSLNCVAIECWESTHLQEARWENQHLKSVCWESSDLKKEYWERGATKGMGFVAWCDSRLGALAITLATLSGVAGIALRGRASEIPAATIAAAALLTWLLDSQRARLCAPALRVLADCALLLPALVALIGF